MFLQDSSENGTTHQLLGAQQELYRRIDFVKTIVRTLLIEIGALQMSQSPTPECIVNFYDEVRAFEAGLIRSALFITEGNQRQAARLLGLGPPTLHAKMRQFGITIRQEPVAIEKEHSVSSTEEGSAAIFVS